jgi:pimeloyl-ACP methyl ester carboxylesterase
MSDIEFQLNKTSNLYFYKIGQGAPLLLIHGNGFDSLVWMKIAKELSQFYTVFAIDRRGFGRSESIDIKYYNQSQSIDIISFIENEIKIPTIIIAWSSGALLAFHAAINEKGNKWIKQLILFEAPYLTSSNSDFKSIKEFIKIIVFQLVGNKIKAAEKFLRLVLQKTNSSNSFDDLDDLMQANFKHNIDSTLAEIKTRTGEDLDVFKLKNLVLPIDFIKSELSPPFIQAANKRLAKLFPNAKWLEIKDAGHFALYEKPIEFSGLIHQLIK